MQYRVFGQRSGRRVSQLALGAAMLGTASGYGAEPEEAARIFNRYADAGGNFIDLSDAYQFGESESLIGELGRTYGGQSGDRCSHCLVGCGH